MKLKKKMPYRGKYSGNLWIDPKTLKEKDLDDSYTKKLWLDELQKDPDFLNDMKDMVEGRINKLKPFMDIHKAKVHIAGESHLDMAYKWRIDQTKQKAVKTLRKAVNHCDTFPEADQFKFLVSSPQIFEWIRSLDPMLFRNIQKWVRKRKIELVGGSWVETDCMMPSGESVVRSRFYGMKYCRDNFGEQFMPQYEWFPDSFGYNVGLPQIISKSGGLGLKTQKMTWCKQNTFPFIHFNWQSPDGSQVLAVCNKDGAGIFDLYHEYGPFRYCLKEGTQKIWNYDDFIEDELDSQLDKNMPLEAIAAFIGKGDGGHGPTHQEVAEMNGMVAGAQNLGLGNNFKWSGLHSFFKDVSTYQDKLAIWSDELYLETHRGTFTTHPEIKRHNRRFEELILTAERLATYLSLVHPYYDYPGDILERMWKTLTLLQFHDILPGTCVPESFDDLPLLWANLDKMISGLIDECLYFPKKSAQDESKVIFYNPLSWDRQERVFIPIDCIQSDVKIDKVGKPPYVNLRYWSADLGIDEWEGDGMPSNMINSSVCQPVAKEPQDVLKNRPAGWWAIVNIPGQSILVGKVEKIQKAELDLKTSKNERKPLTSKDIFTFSSIEGDPEIGNGITTALFDQNTGALKFLATDGVNGGENMVKGNKNLLCVGYEEQSPDIKYPAWNLKKKYWEFPLNFDQTKNLSFEIVDNGPIFVTLEINKELGNPSSPVKQLFRLYKGDPSLYCIWSANWKTPRTLLKIEIDTTTNAQTCVSDQMYCDLRRTTRPKTLRNKARYEKIMHKFVDMSAPDGSWGLSLINEGKYGFDTRGGSSINLSLHKTAEYPPPNAGSWAHIERDIRKDLDWGEVPKYVGLRPISCRFSYYPHKGGTYGKEKGVKIPRVNKKAEEFNNPILVSGNRLHPKNAKAPSPLFSLCSTLSFQTSPNLQIKALKRMEWKNLNSLVLRVVDRTGPGGNIKDKKNTTPSFVKLPVILKNKVQMVRSLDLLEREIEVSFEWDSEENNISYNSRNFEVRTFALDLRG